MNFRFERMGGWVLLGWVLLPCFAGAAGIEAKAPFGQSEYAAAYKAMTSGNAYDGVVQLIELLRTVPGDDVRLADQCVGPAQLLGFGIASLMDWPDRTRLLLEVLKPEEYESDKLLIAVMHAGSGIQSMALPAAATLEQIAKGNHQAHRVTALSILAEPYYYNRSEFRPAVAELALQNPDLEAAQCLIEGPIVKMLRNTKQGGAAESDLFRGSLYWKGDKERLLKASPGLTRVARGLPSMKADAITDDTVAAWAGELTTEKNPRSRYTVLSFLASCTDTPERRAKMREGLENLAAQPPVNPDVLRAHMILVDNGCADHAPDAIKAHATAVLKLGVLPCTADRSMYEASMQTAQKAAKYFTRLGWYENARLMHEALAAKYPDTTLAQNELALAEELRSAPEKAALELIRLEAEGPESHGDLEGARRVYEEIAAHTPQSSLKAAMTQEARRLSAASDKNTR